MIDKEVGGLTERVLTVLVVDDAAVNRRVLCAQLRSEGMQVREAGDGVEGSRPEIGWYFQKRKLRYQ
jgi:PleD family two-component response regulator